MVIEQLLLIEGDAMAVLNCWESKQVMKIWPWHVFHCVVFLRAPEVEAPLSMQPCPTCHSGH